MKQVWFFLLLLLITLPLYAQNVFVINRIDSSREKEGNLIYYGELEGGDESVIKLDSIEPANQFHMVRILPDSSKRILSIITAWPMNMTSFYYESTLPQVPSIEQHIFNPDIITEAEVYFIELPSTNVFFANIKRGRIVIDYQMYPKEVVVYFYSVVWQIFGQGKINIHPPREEEKKNKPEKENQKKEKNEPQDGDESLQSKG